MVADSANMAYNLPCVTAKAVTRSPG